MAARTAAQLVLDAKSTLRTSRTWTAASRPGRPLASRSNPDARVARPESHAVEPASRRRSLPVATLLLSCAMCAPAANPPADAAIAGRWTGTSTCTDLVAAPHCHDEVVRYTFAPGANKAEPVHLVAEKIVAGRYEVMYEMDFRHDAASGSWRHDWIAQGAWYRWSYRIVDGHLRGEVRQLATNAQVRSVTADRLPGGHG